MFMSIKGSKDESPATLVFLIKLFNNLYETWTEGEINCTLFF